MGLDFMPKFLRFHWFHRAACCAALSVCLSAVSAQAETITVFAAASLKAALDDVVDAFELSSDHRLQTSYAGSSALARQIEHGAPADVFISANVGWMDTLEAQNLLVPHTRVALLSNDLVLVSPAGMGAVVDLSDSAMVLNALEQTPLAMAFVDAVPAGIYGKAALTSLGLWDDVSAKVAQTDSVRGALALVARAEARLGVVYATDALAEPRVSIVAAFPADSHAPIVYPAARIAPDSDGARDFAAFLVSPEARKIFESYGFGYAP